MDLKVRLYPPVKVTGQSFVGVKRTVVPKQSMSLREIVKRFMRRESLPLSREGNFEERFGDIEKMSKLDITEQFDKADELKASIGKFKKRQKDAQDHLTREREKKEKDGLPPPPTPTPPEGKPLA